MMKMLVPCAAGALLASSLAATAGGYTAPVVEATPVVVAPAAPVSPDLDWSGFYLGGQAGRLGATLDTGPADVDYDATTYGIHAGYLHDFGRFVGGAELSWDQVKDFEAKGAAVSTDGSMLRGKLLAGYDAGRVLPYLTVGFADLTLDAAGGDIDGNGYLYGLGAKFKATDKIMVGAEVLRHEFKDFNDVDGSDLSATTFGISLSYQF